MSVRRRGAFSELSLLLAGGFVGTDFVAVKYALAGGIPALALAALARVVEPEGAPRRGDLLPLLGLGLVGVTLNHVGYTLGLSLTNGSNAALMFATAPVWGMVLGAALRLERATLRGALGTALALLGVGLVVYEGLGAGGGSLAGDLLVLVSAASWGGYAVLSLPILHRRSPLSVAAYTMLFGGLVVLLISSPDLPSADWGAVGPRAWAALAYSTLFASAFAVAAWQRLASRREPGARLHVPRHPRRGSHERPSARREPRAAEAPGRRHHPRRRLPRPPARARQEPAVRRTLKGTPS